MSSSVPSPGDDLSGGESPDGRGSPTGRYVLVLSDEAFARESDQVEALRSLSGAVNVASTSDYEWRALDVEQAEGADATVFADLGIGTFAADPDRAASIMAAAADDPRVTAVEAEQFMYALGGPGETRSESPTVQPPSTDTGWATVRTAPVEFVDTAEATWGLQATGVLDSERTGQGIGVAVLDTGLDLRHPDFAERELTARSFVSGERAQDGNGHGTHCVGTSCGPSNPPEPPGSRRYGVAGQAEILVGKVLGDDGSGTDTNILAAINWAVSNDCRVISLSLGADIRRVSWRYEIVGRRALNRGSLIVAAAGNNADRDSGDPGFVGVPANSPSIMAVGALDSRLGIADFSARSNPVDGGQVDIAAPGVDVYSTWPMDRRYRAISGTSMATPHVSGIAALWAQRTDARGQALWSELVRGAQRLELPGVDVGAGIAKAPS
ncbi:Subtilase family protein [Actinopolyspora xinjiangensis]|uniref:Subtilase family protein n=1 Tax=Actinopolyspora xinjiangensis TaxID=405564 RepID=A0A1H0RU47_9ACTN|nr:S8 family serine peptidase [Actinopolyspora xinjiangensis]SDP32973.1 Subtilase family protein [Actinopolyspora xinjiangensis]